MHNRIEHKRQRKRTDLNAESAQALQDYIRLCELEHSFFAENINLATSCTQKCNIVLYI